MILLISASQVTRITEVSHWRLTKNWQFLTNDLGFQEKVLRGKSSHNWQEKLKAEGQFYPFSNFITRQVPKSGTISTKTWRDMARKLRP
jgi:hypothetical protein